MVDVIKGIKYFFNDFIGQDKCITAGDKNIANKLVASNVI